jgi:hypothetical protein
VGVLVICVLVFSEFCIVCIVLFVLFRLCVFILVRFVCTSEGLLPPSDNSNALNSSSSRNNNNNNNNNNKWDPIKVDILYTTCNQSLSFVKHWPDDGRNDRNW